MGLAAPADPGEWMVGLEAERTLRDLGIRGDIIKTMHSAFTERGLDRGIGDYVIDTAVLHGAWMRARLPQPGLGFRRCGRRSGVPVPACG